MFRKAIKKLMQSSARTWSILGSTSSKKKEIGKIERTSLLLSAVEATYEVKRSPSQGPCFCFQGARIRNIDLEESLGAPTKGQVLADAHHGK